MTYSEHDPHIGNDIYFYLVNCLIILANYLKLYHFEYRNYFLLIHL